MPSFNYGELPAHPIEAKRLERTPKDWMAVETIASRTLYEPTLSGKTRAEQHDEKYGADSWGVTQYETSDGIVDTQLLNVVAKTPEGHQIDVQSGGVETYQIPVSHEARQEMGRTAVNNIGEVEKEA